MTDPISETNSGIGAQIARFFANVLGDILRQLFWLAGAFAVGTSGSAIACWVYGFPIGLSLLGGLVVLGIAVAIAAM